jgi:hypothetical protein
MDMPPDLGQRVRRKPDLYQVQPIRKKRRTKNKPKTVYPRIKLAEKKFKVEKIVADYKEHGSPTQYKVRFLGFPSSEDLWYTEAALTADMPQRLFDAMLTYFMDY